MLGGDLVQNDGGTYALIVDRAPRAGAFTASLHVQGDVTLGGEVELTVPAPVPSGTRAEVLTLTGQAQVTAGLTVLGGQEQDWIHRSERGAIVVEAL